MSDRARTEVGSCGGRLQRVTVDRRSPSSGVSWQFLVSAGRPALLVPVQLLLLFFPGLLTIQRASSCSQLCASSKDQHGMVGASRRQPYILVGYCYVVRGQQSNMDASMKERSYSHHTTHTGTYGWQWRRGRRVRSIASSILTASSSSSCAADASLAS